ncbi:MAG: lamin tail domain-containing protein [candidate division KSB1 bacterium]|nr:lamin tail domain-containing protein [candidate division KSB1 bacterium]
MAASHRFRILPLVALLGGLAAVPHPGQAQVVLSEIMYDPATDENHDEFVEIFNRSTTDTVSLAGWAIGDSLELDKIVDAGRGLLLAPRQYAVILDGSYFGNSTTYDAVIPPEALIVKIDDSAFGSGGWSNTKREPVILTNAAGDTVAVYRYTLGNVPGHSDEKIDLDAGDDLNNWADSRVQGGTPGAPNSVSLGNVDVVLKRMSCTPARVRRGQSVEVTAVVLNAGRVVLPSCQVAFFWDRNEDGVGTEGEMMASPVALAAPLSPGDSAIAVFTWDQVPAGVHLLIARTEAEGETVLENNEQRITLKVGVWPGEVVVNEVMYRPSAGEPEWVELFNRSKDVIDLRLWALSDSRTTSRTTLTELPTYLEPGAFAIVAEDSLIKALFPTMTGLVLVPRRGWPALNNTGDAVVIWDAAGFAVDSLVYSASWGGETGVSLERIRPDWPTNSRKNWSSCRAPLGGTPNAPNSVRPRDRHVGLAPEGVKFSPSQPSPGEPVRASVWVYNYGLLDVDAGAVAFYRDLDYDTKPSAHELLGIGCQLAGLAGGDSLVCSLALGPLPSGLNRIMARLVEVFDPDTSDDAATGELRVPFPAGTLVVNEIMFRPRAGASEWIELFNPDSSEVDLWEWSISDENIANPVRIVDRHVLVPAGGYVLLAKDTTMKQDFSQFSGLLMTLGSKWPTLNNDADLVVLRDLTGATIDSVAYSASWGEGGTGVSLERVRWEEQSNLASNWRSSRDPRGGTPGAENSVSPAAVDVEVVSGSLQWDPRVPRAYSPVTISAAVSNVGRQNVAVVEVSCYWDANGDAVLADSERIGVPQVLQELRPGESRTVTFGLQGLPPGAHSIFMTVECANDERPGNNWASADVLVAFPVGQVLINEIMYAPSPGQPEWVELYNAGPGEVDLYRWGLGDASSGSRLFGTAHCRIPEGGFAVVAADSSLLFQHPLLPAPVLTVVGGWPTLNNDRDAVRLYDPVGTVVDSVQYFSTWGMRSGVSLERMRYDRASQDRNNWGLSTAPEGATPGRENSISPPAIDVEVVAGSLQWEPSRPKAQQSLRLAALVHNVGRQPAQNVEVTFYWDADADSLLGVQERLAPAQVISKLQPGDTLQVHCPWSAVPPGVHLVAVEVRCIGDSRPANDRCFAHLTVAFPVGQVLVNEIMYAPSPGQSEWVELYNAGPGELDLYGWGLGDATSGPRLFGTTHVHVPQGGFAIVAADSALRFQYGALPAPLLTVKQGWAALNNDQDQVRLYDPAGTVIDSVLYFSRWGMRTGVSLERVRYEWSSGDSANWRLSADPEGATPGRENSVSPAQVDLGIPPGGLVFAPEQPRAGENVTMCVTVCNLGREPAEQPRIEFFWDANRDTIFDVEERLGEPVTLARLLADECTIAEVEWREPPSGLMRIAARVTCSGDQRHENDIALAELGVGFGRGTLIINEIMYSPLSGMGEWVELFNRSEAPVSLEKWYFSDADVLKRRLVSRSPVVVPPGGFAVLAQDSSLAKSGELAPSCPLLVVPSWPALSASGDAVVVFDPQGTVIDSVAYDQSWGGGSGVSLERINPNLPSAQKSNWSSCVDKSGATPGRANSILTVVVPARTTLSVSPSPFSPDGDGRDDFAVISFSLPMTTAAVNIKIYDVTGRLVRFLASNQPTGATNAIVWDGRDDRGQQARIGVYVVYLEALNASAGVVETARTTVVLAGRL